jgi:hypothetical protein
VKTGGNIAPAKRRNSRRFQFRDKPIPISARQSRSDDHDQPDHHRDHKNRDHDAPGGVISQARENNPPDDIERNHQADDCENEAHAKNLSGSKVCRQRRWQECDGHRPPLQKQLRAVVADRFDRATFHCLFTKTFFFGRLRLLVNVGMATVVVALEICRGSFPAQIAVDALFIDIEFAGSIFRIFVGNVGHNFLR